MTDAAPPPGYHPLPLPDGFYRTIGGLWGRRVGDRLTLGFRIGRNHVNGIGICHGGMMVTIADIQMGVGPCVEHGIDAFLVTVSLNSNFVGPGRLGQWIEASSRTVRMTRTLCFVDGLVTADGEPALQASAVMRLPREGGPGDAGVLADFLPPPVA